ncbi:pinensin family lanthipeptide [Roseivirga sp. BDSF3-8]|uniref:pinensin family lanthipeptide n=1 Tax=Roseivirga sp. BDSF3-8 TaxID=3241598 RepID=UPI0035324E0E
MKRKLETLRITSFVTDLNPHTSKTIAGGASLGCKMEAEPLPGTWLCPSVNRCPSVNGYTCPIDDGPKPEGPLPKF